MSVEFEEYKQDEVLRTNHSKPNSSITGIVIKTGIVKDETQANIILILIAIVCAVAAVLVFLYIRPQPPKGPSLEEINKMSMPIKSS